MKSNLLHRLRRNLARRRRAKDAERPRPVSLLRAPGGGDGTRSALTHQPALDGLRGLCLLAVLLFHSELSWMSGGFLGVSTFFTLSGFLITSLLLAAYEQNGEVSMARFWDRRLRRLAPAATLAIAAVGLTAPVWLPRAQQERLAGDAIASLAYLVNWRFVQAEYAYELIFVDPSPLQHFWSLAIEAQFYLVFPLLVGLALRFGGGRRGLAAVLMLLTGASVALSFAPSIAQQGQHRIYYGSDTRAAEILIGALTALALGGRRASGSDELPAPVRWLAAPAFAAMLAAWSLASVDDAWLYDGGFALYAAVSAVVVVSATGRTPVRALLLPGWLRWTGRVSYGAYLYHWPVFLLLTEGRTGLGATSLLAVRGALTLGLAAVSFRLVEEPIRRRRALAGRSFRLALAVTSLVLFVGVLAASPISFRQRIGDLTLLLDYDTGDSKERRWGLFGDSTALSLAPGLDQYLRTREGERLSAGRPMLACGMIDVGERFNYKRWRPVQDKCRDLPAAWRKAALAQGVDVAVVLTGAWESRDWRLSSDGEPVALGDPPLDEITLRAVERAMDELASVDVAVVWLTTPHIGLPADPRGHDMATSETIAQPARQDRMNEIIREAAATRTAVHVLDLAAFVQAWPAGEFDVGLRHDGVHFSREGSTSVANEFLGPKILPILERTWYEHLLRW